MNFFIYHGILLLSPFLIILTTSLNAQNGSPSKQLSFYGYVVGASIGVYVLLFFALDPVVEPWKSLTAQLIFLIALVVQLVSIFRQRTKSEAILENSRLQLTIGWLIILTSVSMGVWMTWLWVETPGAWILLFNAALIVGSGIYFGTRNLFAKR